jgi:hypothetical protein
VAQLDVKSTALITVTAVHAVLQSKVPLTMTRDDTPAAQVQLIS